jgi:hypothetical protein
MELTGLLITFSRGGEPFKEIVDIADLVKNTVLRTSGSGRWKRNSS